MPWIWLYVATWLPSFLLGFRMMWNDTHALWNENNSTAASGVLICSLFGIIGAVLGPATLIGGGLYYWANHTDTSFITIGDTLAGNKLPHKRSREELEQRIAELEAELGIGD